MVSAAEQLVSNLNFAAFAKADELKKRIWFTLGALLIYRLGTYIPIPGINPTALQEVFRQNQSGLLGMFDMFSGGAVGRMAIFALNIMPYISASIIIQLLTTVSPHLEQLKKEGEQGRRQMNQYTRYGTVFLAGLQAYGIAVGLEGAGNVVLDPGWFFRITTVITLVGGTVFLMWLGEQITARGVGNGISLIIFAGIVARLPHAVLGTLEPEDEKHAAEGGVAGRGKRYRDNARVLIDGMRAMGFRTLLPDRLQAPIIVTFHMPTDPKFVFQRFYDGLKDRGYVIYPGKLTVADSFRMGCIGRLYPEHMKGALAAVREVLDELRVSNGGPALAAE